MLMYDFLILRSFWSENLRRQCRGFLLSLFYAFSLFPAVQLFLQIITSGKEGKFGAESIV
jgi:hypothetical protein